MNVLATADGSGVAVLTANYQWTTGRAAHDVSMDVDLPARLAHRRLRLDRYLIDSTTSNDAHDAASSDLQRGQRYLELIRPSGATPRHDARRDARQS